MTRFKYVNNELIQLTAEEEAQRDAQELSWSNNSANRKLKMIREIREQKFTETDWKVTSSKEQGTNLTTSFKNWRQGLRDIPTTYTTESEYDELLARDENGNLTHNVWSE
tara:strand:- start:258 stop:587 length:330 start_codon:yes stop_codon:yes gene_type:complete